MMRRPHYVGALVLAGLVFGFSVGFAVLVGSPDSAYAASPLVWLMPVWALVFMAGVRFASRILMGVGLLAYLFQAVTLGYEGGVLHATMGAGLLLVAFVLGWISARRGPESGFAVGPVGA